MANVRFVKTTKQKWLNRETYDMNALYFCEDTQEIYKGNALYTEGVKVIPTRDALPSFECAADGVVYYITDTKAGFMLAPTRDAWLQTIYAPVADVNSIPKGEEYNVVTTVGAVRDIEKAIYKYIDEEISNISGIEDTSTFGDVVTSIGFDGIPAGTSLNGKTVKDVLIMLLGIKEAPKSTVDYIIDNSIPAYSGTMNNQVEEVEYKQLDSNMVNYTDQGFYTETDAEGNITNAGYQLTIEGNSEADAQVVSIPANAVINMIYRYDLGGTNTWLPYTFDVEDEANYWLPGESFTTTVNGEEVVYQTYAYNIDIVGGGDAITNTEYWRFEIEVTK
jgi:hypothetical protein